ncbi:alpha/beta fold hydrolase [Thalassotalea fusca]
MGILHYQQQGQGEDVVLIHGLFGSLENLNMVAKGLAQHYLVTSVDVRNHGQSFHQDSMTYSELANDVLETLASLGITKYALLGHSMGGKVAMQMALNEPSPISKLIVADIAPVEYPQHHNQIIEGLQSIDLSIVKSRKDADAQLAKYVEEAGVRQFLLRNLAQENGRFYFRCALDFIARNYPQIVVGYDGDNTFDKPTLFVKGGNSDYITSAHRSKIMQHFPQSQAKIIQGAGHWLHAEKTTAFNKIVSDFLQK